MMSIKRLQFYPILDVPMNIEAAPFHRVTVRRRHFAPSTPLHEKPLKIVPDSTLMDRLTTISYRSETMTPMKSTTRKTLTYSRRNVDKGYTDQYLDVDLSTDTIATGPIEEKIKKNLHRR